MSKCVGCGARLQNINRELDGYVDNLEKELCLRCFNVRYYGENKKVNRTNSYYIDIINKIKDDDVIVYVSSLLTLNLDYVNKFRKVILVLTKRDVLPKSVKDIKIINYIKERYLNVSEAIIVSAYKKYNLDKLYNKLLGYKNKNIYFVGITNSGKSTLINEMIKSYNGYEGKITTSFYPSTTLDIVDVKIGNLKIKDTPGILVDNSIVNYLDGKEIKLINSKKEIKPITIQIKGYGAILVGNFLRIEYSTELSSMTLYVSNNLVVDSISLKNNRLLDGDISEYNILDNQDLVIEDIGFIKFTKGVNLKIYSKYMTCFYVRDNLI